MKKTLNAFSVAAFLLILILFSCKRNEFTGTLNLQTNNKSILVSLQSDSSFSILRRALDTTQLSGVLNVYGTMTLFAPNNTAFRKYFARKSIKGLGGMQIDTLKKILQYHLYAQTYTSASFLTGSFPTTTIEGDFIGVNISKGLTNTVLNGSVNIIKRDIPVTNGIYHVIDDVLEPPVNTLLGWLKTQAQYSIMAQAFQQTGLESLLSVVETDPTNILYGKPVKKIRTVFLETNDVLKQAGINSFDDLAKKYSNSYKTTKQYTIPTDSLNIFMRYHIVGREYFVSSVRDEYLETKSVGDFLVMNITGGVALNKHPVYQITFNPVTKKNDTVTTYPYVGIDITNSNIIASNGIVNAVSSVLSVYNPVPVTTLCRFLPNGVNTPFLNNGVSTFLSSGLMFQNCQNPVWQQQVPFMKWFFYSNNMNLDVAINTGKYAGYVSLKYNQAPGEGAFWLELATPQILKGKYDVWFLFGNQGNAANLLDCNMLLTWDGAPLGPIIDLFDIKDSYGNTVVNAARNSAGAATGTAFARMLERKVGTVTLTSLSTHTFRTTMLSTLTKCYQYGVELRPVN